MLKLFIYLFDFGKWKKEKKNQTNALYAPPRDAEFEIDLDA